MNRFPIWVWIWVGGLALGFCSPGNAYVFEVFDSSDGMVPGIVRTLYQDHVGDLWIGTTEGISKYDGKRFQNFPTFQGEQVLAITEDSNGWIWIGTENGLWRYRDRKFQNVTDQMGLMEAGEEPAISVFAIKQDSKGWIWFNTAKGIVRYDGKQFERIGPPEIVGDVNSAQRIEEDRSGNLWFATVGNGVFRYNGQGFQQFTEQDGLPGNWIVSLFKDSSGNLWFGGGTGVSRYDGSTFRILTSSNGGFPLTAVRGILEDDFGHLWFAGREGLCEYDGERFRLYTVEDGLSRNWTSAILADREGNLWVGTWGSGITRVDRSLENFGRNVGRVVEDREGNIWCSLSRGIVHRYNATRFEPYLTGQNGIPQDARLEFADTSGNLWIQSSEVIWRYDGKRVIPYLKDTSGILDKVRIFHVDTAGRVWMRSNDLKNTWMYDGNALRLILVGAERTGGRIFEDSGGGVWIGLWSGTVARYADGDLSSFTPEQGLTGQPAYAIREDKEGNFWMGTWRGLVRTEGRRFDRWYTVDGLENIGVLAIFKDREGNLWFGTRSNGVCRYDGQHYQWFTVKDGLASNWVDFIHQDSRGHFWFNGRDGGITRFDGTNFQRITAKDGLPSNRVYGIFEHETSGTWVFETVGGIVRYVPPARRVPPPITITRIVADKTYEPVPELELPYTATHLAIEYYGKSFRTKRMRYNYMLEGYESEWHKTWDERAEYENLKPGTYTFKVIAIDRDLVYSDEPATVRLTILSPPFYTTTAFLIGAILAAFFVSTAIYTALQLRQRKAAFEPIPNPYIVGNPIRSKDMFFGRENDFQFVRAKLAAGETGLVIVFAGERRSGKTSILFQILNGELGERFVPVLLDMQAMVVDSEAEFLERMATAIEEAVIQTRDARTDSQVPGLGSPVSGLRDFERFIEEVMDALDGRSLLLLFDEYELLETKIDDGVLRTDIITFFAGLLEAHPRLSFIFTGSRHLEQRNPAYWRILIGKSLYRKISFLSERDTLRLVAEPVADVVVYPRGIPERIVRLTGGQPFYTQVVCQNLVDRLNEGQRRRVRGGDITAVAEELADNPLPQMLYFWDGLKYEQQQMLSLLAEVLPDENRYVSAQMLLEFVQEQGVSWELGLAEMERVLDGLFVRDLLERDRVGEGQYEYRLRVDLFRHWIRQAHSVWQG